MQEHSEIYSALAKEDIRFSFSFRLKRILYNEEVLVYMITLAVLIAFIAFVLFAVAICVIVGGIGGLAIVADIVVAVMAIGLVLRLILDR